MRRQFNLLSVTPATSGLRANTALFSMGQAHVRRASHAAAGIGSCWPFFIQDQRAASSVVPSAAVLCPWSGSQCYTDGPLARTWLLKSSSTSTDSHAAQAYIREAISSTRISRLVGRLVVAENSRRDAAPVGNLHPRCLGPVTDGGGVGPGACPVPVLAGRRPGGGCPGGGCPGIRYVSGCGLAEALAVLRAKVNLVGLAIEPYRAGLDVFCLAADITGERYLSYSSHRSFIPAESSDGISVIGPAVCLERGACVTGEPTTFADPRSQGGVTRTYIVVPRGPRAAPSPALAVQNRLSCHVGRKYRYSSGPTCVRRNRLPAGAVPSRFSGQLQPASAWTCRLSGRSQDEGPRVAKC